jgi:3-methylcrotonyl-CoA carboxylase alpha subunit
MTHHTPIKRLLIANRGEIAVRIIKTARRLGIHTIALYSDADARAMHVREADEAWHLGPAPARESYLDTGKVLKIAKEANADAIHPGYGFLSENSDFATACEQRGVRFVGPSGAAILAMGDKSGAKGLMQAAGVPVLPGYHGADQHPDFLRDQASQVGFRSLSRRPAAAVARGCGGSISWPTLTTPWRRSSGRRVPPLATTMCCWSAISPRPPRGGQVFADALGNAIYLGDRDCSLQRRHQKVIEEAPPPTSPCPAPRHGRGGRGGRQAIAYRGPAPSSFCSAGRSSSSWR